MAGALGQGRTVFVAPPFQRSPRMHSISLRVLPLLILHSVTTGSAMPKQLFLKYICKYCKYGLYLAQHPQVVPASDVYACRSVYIFTSIYRTCLTTSKSNLHGLIHLAIVNACHIEVFIIWLVSNFPYELYVHLPCDLHPLIIHLAKWFVLAPFVGSKN